MEVDEIDDLACPASPVHDQFDPVQTTRTSVHRAINMPGLAKRGWATILQASISIVSMIGARSSIDCQPAPRDDPTRRWADIFPAGERSDWTRRTGLEEGLKHRPAHFEKLLSDQ